MDLVWSQKRMVELLHDFYEITHLRTGFFDLEGREIVAYPSTLSGYCRIIRAASQGYEACMVCDRQACAHVYGHRNLYTYRCHAGLTEMIAPIMEQDRILAYLMLGQLRSDPADTAELTSIHRRLRGLGVDTRGLMEAYEALPTWDTGHIKAAAHILQACAGYVWLDDYIRVQDKPLENRVKAFISENLRNSLSLSGLCEAFGVGKTKLCTCVKQAYGLSVGELIRSLRVERAKELLQEGGLSVSQVSEAIGISDYNYFSKIFKLETGITPSIYRKLCENEYKLQWTGQPVPAETSEAVRKKT